MRHRVNRCVCVCVVIKFYSFWCHFFPRSCLLFFRPYNVRNAEKRGTLRGQSVRRRVSYNNSRQIIKYTFPLGTRRYLLKAAGTEGGGRYNFLADAKGVERIAEYTDTVFLFGFLSLSFFSDPFTSRSIYKYSIYARRAVWVYMNI